MLSQARLESITTRRVHVESVNGLQFGTVDEGITMDLPNVLSQVPPPAIYCGMFYVQDNSTVSITDPGDNSLVNVAANTFHAQNNVRFRCSIDPTTGIISRQDGSGSSVSLPLIFKVDVLADIVATSTHTTLQVCLVKNADTIVGRSMIAFNPPPASTRPARISTFVMMEPSDTLSVKVANMGPEQDMMLRNMVICMHRVNGWKA